MSVAAQKWAWEQNLPDRPKFVLVTLADQADSRTGSVRYQRTDTQFFMEKIGIAERSFYRNIAALVRNGYLRRESARGRGKDAQYWLCLQREPTPFEDWSWAVAPITDAERESQDEVESASMADQNDGLVCQAWQDGLPSAAEQDSIDSPKGPKERKPARILNGFSEEAQALERETFVKAQEKPKHEFVIEGTRAWHAWIEHRRKNGGVASLPRTRGQGKDAGKMGWYLPTLFPPTTGPPDPRINEEAANEFADRKTG